MLFCFLLLFLVAGTVSAQVRVQGAPFNVVYGWFPSWMPSTATAGLDASQLTHLAWFSCEVDTSTGALANVGLWQTTPVVQWAKANSVRVHLTVTCFGIENTRALLRDPQRRTRCIADIAAALRSRDADGVNLDLESVSSLQRTNMVTFVQELRDSLPNREITMATPAVDWTGAFDLVVLSHICDFLLLMGYDYHWSGSATAGPVAPLDGETYNVKRSVGTYLSGGVDPLKLVLAVPLYARKWTVVGPTRMAATVEGAESTALRFSSLMLMPSAYARLFDAATSTSWFNTIEDGVARQTWWDDSLSLVMKYRYIQQQQLRGVGYWALGYDGGSPAVWNGLRSIGAPSDVHEEPRTIAETETVSVYDLRGVLLVECSRRSLEAIPFARGYYLLRSYLGSVERYVR